MDAHSSRVKFTFGLIVVICLVAVFLAWRQKKQPDEVIPLSAPVRTVEEVGSDWRSDVTRILSEYDRTQDARAAEQGFLALRVVEQDQDLHLKFVLAFHAIGESRPEGKVQLTEARRRFESSSGVIR
jgi:hypothetical protein